MTPADIRALADDCGTKQTRYVAPQCAFALLALADVIEAINTDTQHGLDPSHTCLTCQALARLDALKP